ncbi:MAG: hypothetical protein IJQ25_03595, partial [Oscillibacter sp.]|nr:hypothetical protein [Oscillibacter sp.]
MKGVFSIAAENPPVSGCTVSALVRSGEDYDIYHFSLAEHTNISAESYRYPKLIIADSGTVELFTAEGSATLRAGDAAEHSRRRPRAIRLCVYRNSVETGGGYERNR